MRLRRNRSSGGIGPDAVPNETTRPRRFTQLSEISKVAAPTESYTTATPAPPVSSRTRAATSSCV